MSLRLVETVTVACDRCTATHTRQDQTAHAVRAEARSRGWSRRHHAGQQIDLCPDCTARGGRPRKTAEPYPVIPEAERRPLGTADWLPRPTQPGDPA